jgi:hypothetical protein
MNVDEFPGGRTAVDIRVWENEGGSIGRPEMSAHYGRRIEANRSWTIYDVFTGVPAAMGNRPMTGLTEKDATATMLLLNRRNLQRRKTAHSKSAFSTRI